MEVLFLGTGNAVNMSGRGQQSLLVERRVLVDFGPTALFNLVRFHGGAEDIDHLVLTHFHGDHIAGIPFLLLWLRDVARRTEPFTIWGGSGVDLRIGALMEATYPDIPLGFPLEFRVLRPRESISLADTGCTVAAFAMDHKPESLGYRITAGGRTLAVSGDTAPGPHLEALLEGVDMGVIEGTLTEPLPGVPHLDRASIAALASVVAPTPLAVIHTDDATKAILAVAIPGLLFPGDGETLTL